MAEIKERKEIADQFHWDLTVLFKNDAEWENAFAAVDEKCAKASSFSGTLNSVEGILAFLEYENAMGRELSNLYEYASLRHSEDTRDSKATAMYQRAYGKYAQFEASMAYAEPELLALPEDRLQEIVQDERLSSYRFLLDNIVRQKAHTLSAKEEILLGSLSEVMDASGQTASTLMDADLVFDDIQDKDGNVLPLSEANYIPYQMSLDRVLRKNAFKAFYKTYQQHIHTFASTYSGNVKAATQMAKIRGYASSRQMSLDRNNIDLAVYDNLIETVHNHMDLMYRYLRLRKKLLKIDDLHYYDVYAPLSSGSHKQYSYDEAKEMVVEAVKPLGEEYVKRVKQAYEERWIDVYPNKGKSGGAYSAGTYDSNPYIMMNFNGSLDSVSTLAHEMGHSQHTWLTNHNQPYHYSNYSLFVAEVASTVNENLLIDQLIEKCDDPEEKLALLNEYLEGFKGTVYRQTMFAEFEKLAHELQEKGESLTSDALCELYEGLIKLYFGDDLIMDEEVKYEWARIPHFYSPFYVYVYATGYTSAVALKEGILKEGEAAVKRYLEFLSMGSSATPLEELRHAGVDLRTPEPIEKALTKFESILSEAEAIAEKL